MARTLPYRIIDIKNPTVSVVPTNHPKSAPQIIHKNRLKPYFESNLSKDKDKNEADTLAIQNNLEFQENVEAQNNQLAEKHQSKTKYELELRRRCIEDQPSALIPQLTFHSSKKQSRYNLQHLAHREQNEK